VNRLSASVHAAALILAIGVAARAGAVDLQGHRGARGVAPENTLAGFRRALEVGVSTLETDLALTHHRLSGSRAAGAGGDGGTN
jgi:glycerophosphoryl diester phosphodiesterase